MFNVPNGVMSFTFKFLALPIGLICILLVFKVFREEITGELTRIFITVFIGFFIIMTTSGHMLWINHLAGHKEIVYIEGRVVDVIKGTGGRSFNRRFIIIADSNGDKIKINVPKSVNFNYEVDQTYSEQWIRGSLGIVYRV